MVRKPHHTEQGQALVEFALISIVLLMLIFVVIEGAHLFQAQITVQNAARAAGRYAVTGQYDETICDAAPLPCDVRLTSIRAVAEEALTGLRLDPGAGFFDPAFFEIQIFGTDAAGNLIADNPGLAGQPVIIRVLYRAEVITPLLRPIAETVLVRGQTVMNNERPVQGQTGSSGNAPVVPALPPVGPTPTSPPPLPPDLTVEFVSEPSRVLINSSFPYRLEIRNLGEEEAIGIVLNYSITGLGTGAITSDGCTISGATIICSLGPLTGGETTTLTINVQTGPDETTLESIVNVAADNEDPEKVDSYNSDTALTEVVNETSTDLALTKTGPSSNVWAESTVAFYLTVENLGLLPATELRVIDTLPPGMTFEPSGSDASCSEDVPVGGREVVICRATTLAPGDSTTTFQINAIAPVGAGEYVNEAEVRMDSPVDSNPGNNLAEFTITVVRAADLWITKSGSPTTVNAGERLTYTLQIGNMGPSAATSVSIDDVLPSSAAFVSATYSTASAADQPCMRGGNVVTCNVGALSVGETATATIVVVPQQGGTMINSAQVSGDETDPNTVNNSAVASNAITLLADLSIVKTARPSGEVFQSGQIMYYELAVTNNGPSRATGVTVRDTLTSDVVYYGAVSSQGYCEFNTNSRLLTCSLGRMSAGQTATIVISVIPTLPTADARPGTTRSYENTGSVTGSEPDDVLNNNSTATTAVAIGPTSIQLRPSCGATGTAVEVLGFNWTTHNKDIRLSWHNAAGVELAVLSTTVRPDNTTASFVFSPDPSWVVPTGTASGTYRIRAVQPDTGDRAEAVFEVPCDGPDLAVGPIGNVASVTRGDPVTFTVNITNTGTAAATSPFNVSLYFDPTLEVTSTTHISSTYRQDLVAFTNLNAGASRTVTFTVESLNVVTGTLPVYVVVDSDPAPEGAIGEMNEWNNLAAGELQVLEGTAAEPPTGTLTLTGTTRVRFGPNYVYDLQPYVRVSVYSGTTWLASAYSAADGSYAFDALPSGGTYDIKACFVQNGISYFELVAGRVPGDPWIENLWLEPGPCS